MMARAAKYTASAFGATVEIGPKNIVISGDVKRIIGPDGKEWGPKLAAVTAGLKAAQQPITVCSGDELADYIRQHKLKPGGINRSKDLLSDGTVLAAVMENGDALITTPANLPQYVSWDHAAEKATEEQIAAQNINIHHLFTEQGVNDHGRTDWRLPNMKYENDHEDDESWMLYKASGAGALKGTFDKTGSFPASVVWSARRYNSDYACIQWMVDGYQDLSYLGLELPVRPVRRAAPQP